MDKNTRWLPVKITDGLFPSEMTVYVPTVDGEVSVFVSSSQLESKSLRVLLLDEDDKYALIQVTSQGGMKVAKVERAELRSTPDDLIQR